MSKTPYEIRLDLLKLAKDTMFESIHCKRDEMLTEYRHSRETFAGEDAPRDPKPFPKMPSFPGTEDILKEAEKFKSFVDES